MSLPTNEFSSNPKSDDRRLARGQNIGACAGEKNENIFSTATILKSN